MEWFLTNLAQELTLKVATVTQRFFRMAETFRTRLAPVIAFVTLVLIFAFQANNLTRQWFAVVLIAVPIIIQVYFNAGLAYFLMRLLRVEHRVAARV